MKHLFLAAVLLVGLLMGTLAAHTGSSVFLDSQTGDSDYLSNFGGSVRSWGSSGGGVGYETSPDSTYMSGGPLFPNSSGFVTRNGNQSVYRGTNGEYGVVYHFDGQSFSYGSSPGTILDLDNDGAFNRSR